MDQVMADGSWWHQVINWTNVDCSSVGSCHIHWKTISEETLKISILDMHLKITNLRLQRYLPQANELDFASKYIDLCAFGDIHYDIGSIVLSTHQILVWCHFVETKNP